MPDEPNKSSEERAPRPVRKVPFGIMAVVQVALAGFILLCANYLSGTNHSTRDLTQNSEFTLSSLTTNLLESDEVAKRDQPVKIMMLVARSSPHHARLRAMLEEYARVGKDGLEVEFIDPVHDTDRALEITDSYGQVITEEFFIIDATPAATASEADDEETSEEAEAVPSPSRDDQMRHTRFVTLRDMLVFREDMQGARRMVGYQDEDLLSSAILSAVEGTPRVMYFLADKSQLQDASENTPWAVLRMHLAKQNILLQPLRISDVETIPADAEGLALVAPQYDLDDREIEMLREYWLRPQSALFVILDPLYRPRNLQAFLRQHGVRMRDDRIITVRNGQRVSSVPATFTYGPQLNRINSELRGKATTFDGISASLEVEENADRLINRRILPVPLIEASARYWGETKYDEENPEFDPVEDTRPPLYLAAAVTRGNANDDEGATQTSRMVVISNVTFLHPQNQYREQSDFITNSAHWLLNREDLMGVGPQPMRNYKLNLVTEQVNFVNRFNLFILPGLFLLVALFVVHARRA